jgi:hypothetical protein
LDPQTNSATTWTNSQTQIKRLWRWFFRWQTWLAPFRKFRFQIPNTSPRDWIRVTNYWMYPPHNVEVRCRVLIVLNQTSTRPTSGYRIPQGINPKKPTLANGATELRRSMIAYQLPACVRCCLCTTRSARATQKTPNAWSVSGGFSPVHKDAAYRLQVDPHIRWCGRVATTYYACCVASGRAAVAEVAGVAGSIHINSIVFVRVFVFFLYSYFYFHLFIFSSFRRFIFPRSPHQVFIFHILIFSYSHIQIFACFQKKCSAHEQYAFRQEDVS